MDSASGPSGFLPIAPAKPAAVAPSIGAPPIDRAVGADLHRPLTFSHSAAGEKKKGGQKPNDRESPDSPPQSEADEGEIRDMFERPTKPPSVIEAEAEEEALAASCAKEQSERESAASTANAALQALQDAAVAQLQSQSASAPSPRPTFTERATARREAAEALGSTLPVCETSPASPAANAPARQIDETRGRSR